MTIIQVAEIVYDHYDEWKGIKTIDGLIAFDYKYGLDLKGKRFFIGYDTHEARVFGIYKDKETGIITVYKNKDTGERAVRYSGTDEAYAVREIMDKFEAELDKRKPKRPSDSTSTSSAKQDNKETIILFAKYMLIFTVATLVMLSPVIGPYFSAENGYYVDQETHDIYYHLGHKDYYYDSTGDKWRRATGKKIKKHYEDDFDYLGYGYYSSTDSYGETYYEDSYDYDTYYYSDFSDTSFYEDYYDNSSSSSSYDSGSSSWDSDWSSSDTDWGSDW